MKYYCYQEQNTTFLLAVDHEQKQFAIGSTDTALPENTKFVRIDQTAYAEHIRKINRGYQCLNNKLNGG